MKKIILEHIQIIMLVNTIHNILRTGKDNIHKTMKVNLQVHMLDSLLIIIYKNIHQHIQDNILAITQLLMKVYTQLTIKKHM